MHDLSLRRDLGLREAVSLGLGGTIGGGIFVLAGVARGGSVELAAQVGGFLYVLHYFPPLIALVTLRRRGGPTPVFETPLPKLTIALAFAGSVVLLFAGGAVGVTVGLAWLLVGLLGRWLAGILGLGQRT